jgi:GntR family transcriptional regulator, carbon starvation induced regulator
VEDQLRSRILSGELPPGSRLAVNRLAAELSVSPTPLRESIQRLAVEGLIELRPQRGAHVVGIELDECRDLYQTRLLLEPLALRRAIESKPPRSWDDEVAAAYRALASAFRANPYDHAIGGKAHLAFHRKLIEPCGSPWLLRLIDQLQHHSVRYRLLSVDHRGGRPKAVTEHTKLRDACRARDAELAVSLLEQHLRKTVEAVTSIVSLHDAAGVASDAGEVDDGGRPGRSGPKHGRMRPVSG